MNGTYNYFLHLINFEVLDVLGCSMTDGESHWAFAQMVVRLVMPDAGSVTDVVDWSFNSCQRPPIYYMYLSGGACAVFEI